MKYTWCLLLCLSALPCLAGCGAAQPSCVLETVLQVSPATGTANAAAKAPANVVQFTASATEAPKDANSRCAIPALSAQVRPQWHVNDATHVQISSAQDTTNGQATCLGPTSGPVTVTATYTTTQNTATANASLTCQ